MPAHQPSAPAPSGDRAAGSQCTSIAFAETLVSEGIAAGTVDLTVFAAATPENRMGQSNRTAIVIATAFLS
jgi:hypothetical protein